MVELKDLNGSIQRHSDLARSVQEYYDHLQHKKGQRDLLLETQTETLVALGESQQDLKTLESSVEVLQLLASLKREEMRKKIENLVTYGLRSVFKEPLDFKIETGTRAKQSTMEFKVVSVVDGREYETSIVNAHGGGLIQIISLLLRIVILLFSRPAPARVLILDESLAHLSREYLDAAGELLKTLSSKLDFQIVMVTHSPEFESYADAIYRFDKSVNGRTKAVKVR